MCLQPACSAPNFIINQRISLSAYGWNNAVYNRVAAKLVSIEEAVTLLSIHGLQGHWNHIFQSVDNILA